MITRGFQVQSCQTTGSSFSLARSFWVRFIKLRRARGLINDQRLLAPVAETIGLPGDEHVNPQIVGVRVVGRTGRVVTPGVNFCAGGTLIDKGPIQRGSEERGGWVGDRQELDRLEAFQEIYRDGAFVTAGSFGGVHKASHLWAEDAIEA